MSHLRLPNGDDHPEAAHKHLQDAGVLLAQHRADGAAYLSGYVVECAIKSLYVLETCQPLRGHDVSTLVKQVARLAAVAGAKSAKYFGQATRNLSVSAIANWRPEMRYRAPSTTPGDAQDWHACARDVYQETIHQMRLDGVIS